MSSTLTFFLGLFILGGLVYLMSRLKQRDLNDAAVATGLRRVPAAPGTKGTTAEGWQCHDMVVATGTLAGVTASLINRSIPKPFTPKTERVATQFTILSLHLPTPPPAPMRLQPVGWSRTLEAITGTPPVAVATGDAAFDAAWHLYTDVPSAALLVLTPNLRRALVDFRNAHVPDGPAWTERANAALLLGSFELTADRAQYVLFGSPIKNTGEHVARATPLLAQLASLRA